MKITAYDVISSSPSTIGAEVQKAISNGWQPFGSPMLDANRTPISSCVVVLQAVVKIEEKPTP